MNKAHPYPKPTRHNLKAPQPAAAAPTPPQGGPPQRFRVEGLARRGRILHANIVGKPGLWNFYGSAGLQFAIKARTVEEALHIARKKLPFRPIALRAVESSDPENDSSKAAT